MRSILRIGSLAIVLAATAVQAQTDLPPGTWAIGKAPACMVCCHRPRADLVVVSLHDALRRELTHALAQGGPAFAIKACHIDVAGVTWRIGAGFLAGRTSDRLRNPANASAAWAAPLVAASGVQRLARDADGFVVDLDCSLGRPAPDRPSADVQQLSRAGRPHRSGGAGRAGGALPGRSGHRFYRGAASRVVLGRSAEVATVRRDALHACTPLFRPAHRLRVTAVRRQP